MFPYHYSKTPLSTYYGKWPPLSLLKQSAIRHVRQIII